jgi:hypothetical protein
MKSKWIPREHARFVRALNSRGSSKFLRIVRRGRARGAFFAVVIALAAMLATPAQTAPTRVIHVDDDAVVGGDGSGVPLTTN